MLRKFYKNDKSEVGFQSALDWGRILGKTLAFIVAIAILIFFGLQVNGFFQRVRANWDEIAFAYQKPNVVKAVRENYYKKLNNIEQEITSPQPTAEEELLREVIEQLKQSK